MAQEAQALQAALGQELSLSTESPKTKGVLSSLVQSRRTSMEPIPKHRRKEAVALQLSSAELANLVRLLLAEFPDAARQRDKYGRLPLHQVCVSWPLQMQPLRALLGVYPQAAGEVDKVRGLCHRLHRCTVLMSSLHPPNPLLCCPADFCTMRRLCEPHCTYFVADTSTVRAARGKPMQKSQWMPSVRCLVPTAALRPCRTRTLGRRCTSHACSEVPPQSWSRSL